MSTSNSKQQAFMQAYQPCHDSFVRYCSALASGLCDTEDLVQDVLLSTYTHFEKIRNKGQMLHYLIRAARNRAISIRRKQKPQAELTDLQAQRLRAQGLSADMVLDIQALYWALNQLNAKDKEAIILFEINGFSIKELAELQGSSLSATKTRLSRARTRLRNIMKEKPTSHSIVGILATVKTITL